MILISDISELDFLPKIKELGFNVIRMLDQNHSYVDKRDTNPFSNFENKTAIFRNFKLIKEICNDGEIEDVVKSIYLIDYDETNIELQNIRIGLIHLINLISRVTYILSDQVCSELNSKLDNIQKRFISAKPWLGNSVTVIEKIIQMLRSLIKKFNVDPSEKCKRMTSLLKQKHFDFIICPTDSEAITLRDKNTNEFTQIISLSDINLNKISKRSSKSLLIGWPKSKNLNNLLLSFSFEEVTLLYYNFENMYHNSLEKRNLDNYGINAQNPDTNQDDNNVIIKLFGNYNTISESITDIVDFELRIDNAQYSKYISEGNLLESVKAKRVNLSNEFFIYSSESHKYFIYERNN